MIKKSLIEILFKAFSIERWNDKLRPIDLTQMDKHAHKMIIAYCLGKYEEEAGKEFVWTDIIKGGIYELIRRSVISDIQSPVYREISKNKPLLAKLNYMIFKEVETKFANPEIKKEFERYLLDDDYLHPHSKRILDAAHKYSTFWEFKIVKNANPDGFKIDKIALDLGNEIESYFDLEGIRKISKQNNIKNFIDLCGELRYQIRWGHLPRIPRTSVLGHVMLVATISYFLTKELNNPCDKRIYNNFFGALFHDLPEVVTRDIIKPVKRSVPGMQEEIRKIEMKLAEEEIYPLIEKEWIPEIKYFTQDEFTSKILDGQKVNADEISLKYNSNEFNPYDGTLLKAADDFGAFLEAFSSIEFGIRSNELELAKSAIKSKYENVTICGIEVSKLFAEF